MLSSCELFCTCAAVLLIARTRIERDATTSNPQNPFAAWGALFEHCAEAEDTMSIDVCPSSGRWSHDGGETYFACIPGTVDPYAPSMVAPEALLPPTSSSSSARDVVEAAPYTLPQSPQPSGARRTLRPPPTIDCTDPANAGRGHCAGTNRENKPLVPPEGL
jgi:hypothetical protein